MTNLPSRDAALAGYLELKPNHPLSEISMYFLAQAPEISLADLRRVVESEEALWWHMPRSSMPQCWLQAGGISGTPR